MEEAVMMDPYIAADCELSEEELDLCTLALNRVIGESLDKVSEREDYIRPHVSIAEIMGAIAKLQSHLMSTSDVLLEAMEESPAASDQLLRTQDVLTSLEYAGQCLNRSYYGACRLVIDMAKDDELHDAAVTAALKLTEAYKAQKNCNAPS